MESVDQVGRRERFLQSNFESLSGPEDSSQAAGGGNSNSISAQQRNAGTIGELTDSLIDRPGLKPPLS